MDVNSAFWKAAPEGIKQSIIYNYFLLLRSQEELKHLEQDMLNTLNFFKKKKEIINGKLVEIRHQIDTCKTPFIQGMYCLLKRLEMKVNLLLLTAVATFSQFIKLPSNFPQLEDYVCEESTSDVESDSDVDDEDETDLYNES